MDAHSDQPTDTLHEPTVVELSDRGITFRRRFHHPVSRVFDAWSQPAQFRRWWVPRSMGATLQSCDMDVRVGGRYRLAFEGVAMAFFGTYTEVVGDRRIVWTNEESGDQGAVTTVTFEPAAAGCSLTLQELYPSQEAFQAAGAGAGSAEMMSETFKQLEDWLRDDHGRP